jgi:hypothetical protein
MLCPLPQSDADVAPRPAVSRNRLGYKEKQQFRLSSAAAAEDDDSEYDQPTWNLICANASAREADQARRQR